MCDLRLSELFSSHLQGSIYSTPFFHDISGLNIFIIPLLYKAPNIVQASIIILADKIEVTSFDII